MKMPKPADLSVLGLRPYNDLTPTRSLSTRMHDLIETDGAPARSMSRFQQKTTPAQDRELRLVAGARSWPSSPARPFGHRLASAASRDWRLHGWKRRACAPTVPATNCLSPTHTAVTRVDQCFPLSVAFASAANKLAQLEAAQIVATFGSFGGLASMIEGSAIEPSFTETLTSYDARLLRTISRAFVRASWPLHGGVLLRSARRVSPGRCRHSRRGSGRQSPLVARPL